MATKTVVIKGVTVAPGDIVKIKFRKLEDILQDSRNSTRMSEIISHYCINEHMPAFVTGGHFKIEEVFDKDTDYLDYAPERRAKNRQGLAPHLQEKVFSEIRIVDHQDKDGSYWRVNDLLIESISLENDSAETYFSERHQLSLVYMDNTLFVNGEPLTAADSKIFQLFEKVLAEAAINNILSDAAPNQEEEDDFI